MNYLKKMKKSWLDPKRHSTSQSKQNLLGERVFFSVVFGKTRKVNYWNLDEMLLHNTTVNNSLFIEMRYWKREECLQDK